jgi:PAS domain S-box-containing protein
MSKPVLSNPYQDSVEMQLVHAMAKQLRFNHLPDYACFLVKNRIPELALEQHRISIELKIPLLRHFEHHTKEQLLKIGEEGIRNLLNALAANRAAEYIEDSVSNWINNNVPQLTRNQISPEDISLLSFIRCKIFRDALPYYTADQKLSIQIMEEINSFTSVLDAVAIRTFIQIQQELHEQAQQIAHIGTWSLDLKTNTVAWSNELYRIYELDPLTALTDLASFNHPEDAELVHNEIEHSKQSGKQHDFYYRIVLPDGREKHLHALGQVQMNEQGVAEKMFGTLQDVTEQVALDNAMRHHAEEMRKQEDRYFKMINEVQDYAILLLSTEGIVENWNNGAEKIKGYKADEIVGKNFRIFYPPEDRANMLPEQLILEATQKGRASHEGWRLRKDQTRFWGSIVITALHDKQGEVIGFSKVTRDLTQLKLAEDERRRYTQELEIKNRELEQKNKELESFTYIASHDLQEPVRKIRIWANRIEEKEGISDEIQDFIHKIHTSSIRMQKLIQGVLQYSQSDMMLIPRELTDLDQVLEEVLLDLSESLQEKQITVERDHLPALMLMRLQFVQLFSNIISNAIKYSRNDISPHIKITCTLEQASDSKIPGVKKSFYEIAIADNGIGFLQENAEKAFELFRRLESNPRYIGAGIGLAICKKIVSNHQGTISATSEPGKGARFTIRLPAQ